MSLAVSRPVGAGGYFVSITLSSNQFRCIRRLKRPYNSLSHPVISMDHTSIWSFPTASQVMKLEFCLLFDPFQSPDVLSQDIGKVLQDFDECAVGHLVLESLHGLVAANLASEVCLLKF